MSFNNPLHSVPADKPEKPKELEGVLGNVNPEYAKKYYPAMASLEESIANGEKMLLDTKNPNLVGRLLREDRLALIALKEDYGVPLTEQEKAMKADNERKAA